MLLLPAVTTSKEDSDVDSSLPSPDSVSAFREKESRWVLRAMRTFSKSSLNSERTKQFLSLTSSVSQIQLCYHGNDAKELLQRIIDVMVRNPRTPIQFACLQLLRNLFQNSVITTDELKRSKGIPVIMRTLLTYRNSLPICRIGVNIFIMLLNSNGGRDGAIIVPLFQFYCVEVIVTTAKTFIYDMHFQESSLKFLKRLAELSIGSVDGGGDRRSGQARAALRVLKRYKNNEGLCTIAFDVLHLCTKNADEETIEELSQIGAVRIITTTIIAFKVDASLQRNAYGSLHDLTTRDPECARQLGNMRGAELVMRGIKRYRGCISMNEDCAAMLTELVSISHVHTISVFTAGGVETTLSLIIEYMENVNIQKHTVVILDRLAGARDDIFDKILDLDGIRILSKMLRFHVKTAEIIEPGTATLRYLRFGW